ncbi:MAG TPA: alginate export family protein [Fontimonas sp.]
MTTPNRLCGRFKLLAISAAVVASTTAAAQDLAPGDYSLGLKLKLAGFAEGARDLGQIDIDGSRADPDGETTEGYVDVQPVLFWRMSENWNLFTRLQGFVPSGEIVVTDDDQPRRTESYAAIREAWVEYGGLTSYPGETLRIGRQRLREQDGSWMDRDADAIRWIFDTTLLQGHVGIATELDTFRTGDSELPPSQRDRGYAFGGLSGQWTAGNYIGARALYAFDYSDLDEEAASLAADAKRYDRQFVWLGAYVNNGYYSYPKSAGLYYSSQIDFLTGRKETVIPGELPGTDQRDERDVSAFAGDIGLRLRLDAPFAVGVAYAFGQGGGNPDVEETYEQSGLHSNRSRYTGTRSRLYRFNEALQPELSNLHVATAYVSVPAERFDASLVYHRFQREQEDAGIIVDGIDVQPSVNDDDIGEGYDLVLTGYFGSMSRATREDDDDLRSNVSLRGSLFRPGDAFGAGELDDQYRVILETTLWF